MYVIRVEKTRKLKHLSKDVMEIEREDISIKADKTHILCKRKSNVCNMSRAESGPLAHIFGPGLKN